MRLDRLTIFVQSYKKDYKTHSNILRSSHMFGIKDRVLCFSNLTVEFVAILYEFSYSFGWAQFWLLSHTTCQHHRIQVDASQLAALNLSEGKNNCPFHYDKVQKMTVILSFYTTGDSVIDKDEFRLAYTSFGLTAETCDTAFDKFSDVSKLHPRW